VVIDGAITLQDASGNDVPGTARYELAGSPVFTSDPLDLPYGPALVFSPDRPLVPNATYRLQLASSAIRARNGAREPLAAADQSRTFTTEDAFFIFDGDDSDTAVRRCPAVAGGSCAGSAFAGPVTRVTGTRPTPVVERFNAEINASTFFATLETSQGIPVPINVTVGRAVGDGLDGTDGLGRSTGAVVTILPEPLSAGWPPAASGYVLRMSGIRSRDSSHTLPDQTVTFQFR